MRIEIVLILLLITTIVSGRRTHHHGKDVQRFSRDTEEGRQELIKYYNEDVEAVSKLKGRDSSRPHGHHSNGSGNKKPSRPNKRPTKRPKKKGPNKKKPRPNRS